MMLNVCMGRVMIFPQARTIALVMGKAVEHWKVSVIHSTKWHIFQEPLQPSQILRQKSAIDWNPLFWTTGTAFSWVAPLFMRDGVSVDLRSENGEALSHERVGFQQGNCGLYSYNMVIRFHWLGEVAVQWMVFSTMKCLQPLLFLDLGPDPWCVPEAPRHLL